MPFLKTLVLISLVLAGGSPFMIGGGGVSGLYPYEALMLFVLLVIFLKSRKVVRRRSGYLEGFISLFWLWVLFGLGVNVFQRPLDLDFISALGFSGDFLQIKLVGHAILTIAVCSSSYLAGRHLFDAGSDLPKVSWAIVLGATIASTTTILTWLTETGGVITRYNFTPPTGLGQGDTSNLALIGLMVGISLVVNTQAILPRLFIAAGLASMGICISIIQSRASYIFAAAHLGIAGLILTHRAWTEKKGAFVRVVVVAVLVIFISTIALVTVETDLLESMTSDFVTTNSVNIENRVAVHRNALALFFENPLVGVGWGQFVLHSTVPMMVSGEATYVATPHNGLMGLLSETGLIGTIIAMIVSIFMLRQVWLSYRSLSSSRHRIFTAMVLILLVLAVLSQIVRTSILFPPPGQRNMVRLTFYMWFVVGYAINIGTNLLHPSEAGRQNKRAPSSV